MKTKKDKSRNAVQTETAENVKSSRGPRTTNLLVIFMAMILIALSVIVLFLPEVEFKAQYLCIAIGAAVIIAGIVHIVKYFVSDAYKDVNEYGFSIGTLFVILGVCALLRADVLAGAIDLVMAVAVLLMGIIMLQHALDLNRMKDAIWAAVLILAAIVTVDGVVLILKPSPEKFNFSELTWWSVLVASILSLAVNIYTLVRVTIYKMKEEKEDKDEQAAVTVDTADSTSPEADPVQAFYSSDNDADATKDKDDTLQNI